MNRTKTLVTLALLSGLATPVLADNHGQHAKPAKDAISDANRKEQKLRKQHDATEEQKDRIKEKAEKERDQLKEQDKDAREKADKVRDNKHEKMKRHHDDARDKADKTREKAHHDANDADDAVEKTEKTMPPGMEKRDEHPSTGKGSEQGQESRAKQEKKWWRFWQ